MNGESTPLFTHPNHLTDSRLPGESQPQQLTNCPPSNARSIRNPKVIGAALFPCVQYICFHSVTTKKAY